MGYNQIEHEIEYIVVSEVALPPPVKKQVWDGEKFVPMTLHKHRGVINETQEAWMRNTFGREGVYKNGRFWDYSRGGDFTLMDEQVYVWFQMKWGNK